MDLVRLGIMDMILGLFSLGTFLRSRTPTSTPDPRTYLGNHLGWNVFDLECRTTTHVVDFCNSSPGSSDDRPCWTNASAVNLVLNGVITTGHRTSTGNLNGLMDGLDRDIWLYVYTTLFFGRITRIHNYSITQTDPSLYQCPHIPPLLRIPYIQVEIGINPSHILAKSLTVLNPLKRPAPDIMDDADLAGPMVFCFGFALVLLLVSAGRGARRVGGTSLG